MRASGASGALECPTCAAKYAPEERFCPTCGTPLVHGGEAAVSDPLTPRQELARKIKPQFAEGELVYVAGARNQAEGEFIQGLLLEEGVPSLLRRSAGFDVPDFLAAGPRDVLVPQSGEMVAREVLLQAEIISAAPLERRVVAPGRLLAGLLAGVALVFVVIWLGTQVLR
ncbi:MAG TPA: zinc ribbon domain-containing protein [Solirubrobacteraceae bacterium]|nr:zinc ribbon domain-containing protein [Solirubrobacteraceae bacterium]